MMFSGDLLFAGSIGRTDLPGGDHPTMLRSLAAKVLPLADDIVVLDGGRIIERGDHAQLMAEPGRYAHMFSLQAKGYQ